MNRVQYEISDILKEIEGSPNGVGYDVSLTQIYDDIKNAKFDEDGSVSFGIWERELKKADWVKTEKLAFEAIQKKSKDLQIVGWLMESLIALDGLKGITLGIDILTSFLKSFWESSYPRNEDNSSDYDKKHNLLSWIFDMVAERSKFIPIIKIPNTDEAITLYAYEYALNLMNSINRSPNASTEIMESAKKSGAKSIVDIKNIIESTNLDTLNVIKDEVQNIRSSKDKFDTLLLEILPQENLSSFSALMSNLHKIDTLIQKKTLPMKEPEEQLDKGEIQSPITEYEERDEIYNTISVLSRKLAIIEKHSPSSFILDLVVSWKDKTLLQIIDDLKQGDSEAHKLLKFLMLS